MKTEKGKTLPCMSTADFAGIPLDRKPRHPSADEWIRKLWYIYTMEYYSAIKKNSFESVLMRCMNGAHYTEWSKPER